MGVLRSRLKPTNIMSHTYTESETTGVKMKALVVFLLAALGCSLSEGWLISKCELKKQLMTVIEDMRVGGNNGLTNKNILAKIVCHVEGAAGFNTSAVTVLRSKTGTEPTETPTEDESVWTLYGLFQLSSNLVCSDGVTQSPNICTIDCRKLIDDDIEDDIICLLKLLTKLLKEGFAADHWKEFQKMITLLFPEQCGQVTASEYFAECN